MRRSFMNVISFAAAAGLLVPACGGSDDGAGGQGGPGSGAHDGGVDRSCIQTRIVRAAAGSLPVGNLIVASGSSVYVVTSVVNCAGEPIDDLSAADFEVLEGERVLSSEAQVTVVPRNAHTPLILLTLDMSASTRPVLDDLIAGAKSLLTKGFQASPQLRIGLAVFAGEANLTMLSPPTRDIDYLNEQLDGLRGYEAGDTNSSNVNGAVVAALETIRAHISQYEAEQLAGGFASGSVILFTDGADTAKRVTVSDARRAYAAGRERVLAVALRGSDFTDEARAALTELANDGVVEAPTSGELGDRFASILDSIQKEARATYLLSYCSPARSGTQSVSVRVKGAAEQRTLAAVTFDASAFDLSEGNACAPDLLSRRCVERSCGLLCGTCAEGESCQSGTCQSKCALACERKKVPVRIPEDGPTVTCEPVPGARVCATVGSTGCQLEAYDNANCGGCGNQCRTQTEYGTCVMGTCEFPTKIATTSWPGSFTSIIGTHDDKLLLAGTGGPFLVAKTGGDLQKLTFTGYTTAVDAVGVRGGEIFFRGFRVQQGTTTGSYLAKAPVTGGALSEVLDLPLKQRWLGMSEGGDILMLEEAEGSTVPQPPVALHAAHVDRPAAAFSKIADLTPRVILGTRRRVTHVSLARFTNTDAVLEVREVEELRRADGTLFQGDALATAAMYRVPLAGGPLVREVPARAVHPAYPFLTVPLIETDRGDDRYFYPTGLALSRGGGALRVTAVSPSTNGRVVRDGDRVLLIPYDPNVTGGLYAVTFP